MGSPPVYYFIRGYHDWRTDGEDEPLAGSEDMLVGGRIGWDNEQEGRVPLLVIDGVRLQRSSSDACS